MGTRPIQEDPGGLMAGLAALDPGLLALASGLIEAGAPSSQPGSFGQGLSRGLMGMLQARQGQQQQQALARRGDLEEQALQGQLGEQQRRQQQAQAQAQAQAQVIPLLADKGLLSDMTPEQQGLMATAFPGLMQKLVEQQVMPKPPPKPQIFGNGKSGFYRLDEGADTPKRMVDPMPAAAPPPKAPETRKRIEGDQVVQEEFVDGQWRELSRGQRWQPETPEAEKGQTPERAAKTQMVSQALETMDQLEPMLFDQDGSPNRLLITGMIANVPGNGRTARIMILDAVEAKLRAESGAAVPDSEVARAADRFMPRVADSAENIRTRMQLLRGFLQGTIERIRGPGRTTPAGGASAPAGSLPPDINALVDKYAPR